MTCYCKWKKNNNNMENTDDVYILKRNMYFWNLIVDRVFLQTTQGCSFIFCGNLYEVEMLKG